MTRVQRIRRRLNAGFTKAAIARHLGISRQRLEQILHPEQRRARRKVMQAVIAGNLRRPSRCPSCRRRGRVEAHHEDYSAPLEVIWLCRRCHCRLHREQIDPDRLRDVLAIAAVMGAYRA